MSDVSPKNSSLFLYVPVTIFGIILIAVIFKWQFSTGEQIGASLPPPVKAVPASKVVNHRALAQETGLSADGKMLYQINCASCHGNDGQGDGPRSAGLNPPARNYKTEQFKYGTDVAAIYNTLMKGSPGTSMPSFSLLPARDVWAMVHYVRTLIPNPAPTDDAVLAVLPEAPAGAAGDAGTATAEQGGESNEGRIPIALAMQQIKKSGYITADNRPHTIDANDAGAQLYLNRCASCHGQRGEGMSNVIVSVNPYRYGQTAPLYATGAPWLSNRARFDDIVLNGRPGRIHPGFGALTRAQLDQLYAFIQRLSSN